MKRSSLTRQLIGGVLLAELICAAVFSFVALGHEMHGRRRAFDVMLRGRADSLLGAVQDPKIPTTTWSSIPRNWSCPGRMSTQS